MMKWTWRLALFAACGDCLAVDWVRAAEVGSATEPWKIEQVVADGDGYLLLGRTVNPLLPGQQAFNEAKLTPMPSARWVRVGADGSVRMLGPERDWAAAPNQVGSPRPLLALGHGRFAFDFLADNDGRDCLLPRLDANGRTLSVAELPGREAADCQLQSIAEAAAQDAGGGLWPSRPNRDLWQRIRIDGEIESVPRPQDAATSFRFVPLPDAIGAYALYSDVTQSGFKLARITRQRVEWHLKPGALGARYVQVLCAANGDALLVGQHSAAGMSEHVALARYATDGSLRWERTYPELRTVPAQARVLDGDRLALATSGSGATLEIVSGADGSILASHAFGQQAFGGFVPGPSADPRAAPAAFAYFVSERPVNAVAHRTVAIHHVDARGQARAIPANEDSLSRAALLADGSLVHVLQTPFNPLLQRSIEHRDADGRARPVPVLDRLIPGRWRLLRGHVGSDGDSYTLGGVPGEPLQLRAWSAEGRLRWQHTLPAATAAATQWERDVLADDQAQIVSALDRVCVGPVRQRTSHSLPIGRIESWNVLSAVRCLRRDNGALLYAHERLPGSSGGPGVRPLSGLALRADGSVALIEAEGITLTRVVLDADGGLRVRRPLEPAVGTEIVTHFAEDGSVLVASSDGVDSLRLLRLDAQGGTQVASSSALGLGQPLRIAALDSGLVLLHSQKPGLGEQFLSAIEWNAPALRALWTQRATTPALLPSGHTAFTFTAGGGRIIRLRQSQEDERMLSTLERLDPRTGAVLWRDQRSEWAGRGVRGLTLDLARQLVWVSRDRPGSFVLNAVSLADGQPQGKRGLNCGEAGCGADRLAIATDGSLRSFAGLGEVARIDTASALQPAPTAQPALRGSWYAPGTSGQGLVVDFAAASGDLFAGWFGFTTADVHAVSGLKWLSLSGRIAAGAEQADLEIHSNSGGQFVSGPSTRAQTVGQAELRLVRCNEAVLSYRFDRGDMAGLQGEVGLQRLTPALSPCIDFDRQTVPTPLPVASAGPLRASHSGAWYAPSLSGQGLVFELRPPSANHPGLLFGGWFSYDPVAAADDADAQHWFMLQGELDAATGASQQVLIYRVSGGRFDQRATRNVQRVGIARLDFQSCSTARLQFRFDDSDVAGRHAGREGQMDLRRLLPCAE